MSNEPTDTREDITGYTEDEIADNQCFADNILQEGLDDALINNCYEHKDSLLMEVFRCEADELWSFVGNKANKQWIWMAMNTDNRQIIALHIGGRGIEHAWKLWENIPSAFQQQATFFTDFWKAYNILDQDQHHAAGKDKGHRGAALSTIWNVSIVPCANAVADWSEKLYLSLKSRVII